MTYATDGTDELKTSTKAGITTSFLFDKNGSRTSATMAGSPAQTTRYGYDAANRLTSVDAPSASTDYGYGADGLLSSISGTHDASLVWDGTGGGALLLDDGSTSYLYGPTGVPFEQITGTTVTYLHQDQLGSTRLLTDSSGNVAGSYSYSTFGKTTAHTGASTALQWGGQYKDSNTGLYYMRARFYDASTGQFLTVDPIVDLTGDAYGYAYNDPINGADPSGLGFCMLGSNPGGGCRGGDTYNSANEHYNLMYPAVANFIGAYDALRNGCSLADVGKQFLAGVGWTLFAVVIVASGFTGGAAEGAIARGAANGAGDALNGLRLGQQLARESADSVFSSSGRLSSGAIADSKEIISGSRLGNKDLIGRLTSDGSDIADWGKYTTRTHQSPSGDFQVHFYMNRGTGAIDYGYDYKVIFKGAR